MVRRLLPVSILRTRSASKAVVARSVIVWLSCAAAGACDHREVPRPTDEPQQQQRPVTSQARAAASTSLRAQLDQELAALAREAGLELPPDPIAVARPPAAPAGANGDLKSEVEAFTSLDACVRAQGPGTPLVGDALDALGYDALTRDACRTVEALKLRSPAPCQPIAFAALRARCEAQVATLTGNAALCPRSGSASAPRDPTCLARAARDARLCLAASESERPTCRALVTGNTADCGNDRACARRVERWRGLGERANVRPDFVTACQVDVVVDDGPPQSVELPNVAAMGAVLQESSDKLRITVGRPKTNLWARPEDPWATAQLFIGIAVPRPAATSTATSASDFAERAEPLLLGTGELTLELLVPKLAALSAVTSRARRLNIKQLGTGLGASIDLELVTEIAQAPHDYVVTVRLQTFVRESVR